MLLSGENGVGKCALAGRWLRSLEPKAYFPVCITQASLTGIGVLAVFLQKLGKTPRHQRSINLKLLEEAFARTRTHHSGAPPRRGAKLQHRRARRSPDAAGTQPSRAARLCSDPGRRSLPALRPAPAFPSGSLLPHRRSRLHRESEALRSSKLISSTNSARSASNVPALNPRRSICWPAQAKAFRAPSIFLARAAWIEAAKEKALQISATHLQSALELVPGVLEIRQNSSPR